MKRCGESLSAVTRDICRWSAGASAALERDAGCPRVGTLAGSSLPVRWRCGHCRRLRRHVVEPPEPYDGDSRPAPYSMISAAIARRMATPALGSVEQARVSRPEDRGSMTPKLRALLFAALATVTLAPPSCGRADEAHRHAWRAGARARLHALSLRRSGRSEGRPIAALPARHLRQPQSLSTSRRDRRPRASAPWCSRP